MATDALAPCAMSSANFTGYPSPCLSRGNRYLSHLEKKANIFCISSKNNSARQGLTLIVNILYYSVEAR